jgi:hypothetical protein
MKSNTHYQKAVLSEPAMVRGADLLIREIMNRSTEATLAMAVEQRIANLIAMSSLPAFTEDKDAIIAEIRELMGLTGSSKVSNADDDQTGFIENDAPKPEEQYGVFEFKKPFI